MIDFHKVNTPGTLLKKKKCYQYSRMPPFPLLVSPHPMCVFLMESCLSVFPSLNFVYVTVILLVWRLELLRSTGVVPKIIWNFSSVLCCYCDHYLQRVNLRKNSVASLMNFITKRVSWLFFLKSCSPLFCLHQTSSSGGTDFSTYPPPLMFYMKHTEKLKVERMVQWTPVDSSPRFWN